MSETRFTPGPWSACKKGECPCGFIWDSTGEVHIASAHDSDDLGKDWFGSDVACIPELRAANAKLIAAAPDLYKALWNMVALARPFMSDEPQMLGLRLAQEALARARGEPTA